MELITALSPYGSAGLFIAYLLWDRQATNKVASERIKADLEVAKALTMLGERIK
jgi:hypothetical protein